MPRAMENGSWGWSHLYQELGAGSDLDMASLILSRPQGPLDKHGNWRRWKIVLLMDYIHFATIRQQMLQSHRDYMEVPSTVASLASYPYSLVNCSDHSTPCPVPVSIHFLSSPLVMWDTEAFYL